MRKNLAGSPLSRALDTSPLRFTRVVAFIGLAGVTVFRLLGAAMVLRARTGGPEGAKASLERPELGLKGRLT